MRNRFPNLFRPTMLYENTRAQFEMMEQPPDAALIANVNIVPYLSEEEWVFTRLENGRPEIPGGTLEPGENYETAIRRELLEEAGARLLSSSVLGGWHCRAQGEKPYRPHLPHPVHYRFVVVGKVELIAPPANPGGQEQIAHVEVMPVEAVAEAFIQADRPDIAELYRYAALNRKSP